VSVAVRTKLLAVGGKATVGYETIYATPSGRTTILKRVTLNLASGTGGTAYVVGRLPSGLRIALMVANLTPNVPQHLDTWMVFPAGYDIQLQLGAAADVYYWLSGTELLGEPDIPTVPTGNLPGTLPG
jgi:hypothetical protein